MTSYPLQSARVRTLQRIRVLLRRVAALVILLSCSKASAGDGRLKWKTIESEHFIVHYHEPLGDMAKRSARAAETAYELLTPELGHRPKFKTHIGLTDTTDSSNGSARVVPRNEIQLIAVTPSDTSSLSEIDDWLFLLIVHEYSHILHLDTIVGLPLYYNRVFGKSWAPNQIQPSWIIEGVATVLESRYTRGGRLRSSLYQANLRMATLEDDIRSLDQVTHIPRAWPHGDTPYLYGSYFLHYICERYGEGVLRKMSRTYASMPIPFGINKSIRAVTGKSFPELFKEWLEHQRTHDGQVKSKVMARGLRQGRKITTTGEVNGDPVYSRDGKKLVWIAGDGYSETRHVWIPRGATEEKKKTYATIDGASAFDLTSDGALIVQQRFRQRSFYSFDEIAKVKAGATSGPRLTRYARATDPSLSSDDSRVAYATNSSTGRSIAVATLRGHKRIKPKVVWRASAKRGEAFAPDFSPDGKHLAFSVWRPGGARDIVVMDLETKTERWITRDRAQDVQPFFDPQGRYLLFSSDRSGIFNIYAYEFSTEKIYQVTNVLGAALSGALSPDARSMAYQGYNSRGWDLYEIKFEPQTWLPAEPYQGPVNEPRSVLADDTEITEPRSYNPLLTLAPLNYTLSFSDASSVQSLGLTTFGIDVLGHHRYDAAATLQEDRLSFSGSYAFTRLWPTLRFSWLRALRTRGGYESRGRQERVDEELLSATLSLALPVVRLPSRSATLSLDYDLDQNRRVGDFDELVYPDAPLPVFPSPRSLLSGVALRFSYSDVESFRYAVGPQIGKSLALSLRLNHSAFGSDIDSLVFGYSWNSYLSIARVTSLALRISGVLNADLSGDSGRFGLGGVPEQDLVQALFSESRAGRTGYLRGFQPNTLVGTQYHLLNAEIRRLFFQIERGLSTHPVYLRRIYGALLVDVGSAYDETPSFAQSRSSLGAALRLEALVGWILPLSLDLGVSRGLGGEGITEAWTLITTSF